MKNLTYFSMGVLPCYVGLCVTEKAYKKEIKHLKAGEAAPFFLDGKGGATRAFESSNGLITILVCINKADIKKRADTSVYALIVHEAYHAMQYIWECMGERAPGEEVAAYTIQSLSLWMMDEAKKIRGAAQA